MVNTRTYILPTCSVSYRLYLTPLYLPSNQTPELHLRYRLYSALWTRPHQVTMLTCCSGRSHTAQRFPVPDSLLQEATMQPYVHNCFVNVCKGRHIYRFCIFFKQHLRLRANVLLSSGDHKFQGDTVVMRVGVNHPSVVNMRARDNALADFIIHQ
ncbi:hypothetical protein F4604DRAFT_1588985 [Suillus subluteus]|nr:hypothetical protein F4604DRAFT_1588985 [Suillus subluteus]